MVNACSTKVIVMQLPSNRPSQIENAFYSQVPFFSLDVKNVILKYSYTKITNESFSKVQSSFKDTPDYQTSSNSIYRSTGKCMEGDNSDHHFVHCPFLSEKNSKSELIQIQDRFKYLKENKYCDLGKFEFYIFILTPISTT